MIELRDARRDKTVNSILKRYEIKDFVGFSCPFQGFFATYYFNDIVGWFVVVSDLIMNNLYLKEIEWVVLHEVAHKIYENHINSNRYDQQIKRIQEHRADFWASDKQMKKYNRHYGISALQKLPGLIGKSVCDPCLSGIGREEERPLTYRHRIEYLQNYITK